MGVSVDGPWGRCSDAEVDVSAAVSSGTLVAGYEGTLVEKDLLVFERAQENYISDVCETTFSVLTMDDVELLCNMATDEGSCRVADISERMGETLRCAQRYRRRFIDAGVIEVSMRVKMPFAAPYLREWLDDEWALEGQE